MSEEIKNNGAEVNEAELENVSGGYGMDDMVYEEYCDRCDHRSCGPEGTTLPQAGKLIKYIEANGRPKSYRECPFYKGNN